jgi:CHAT domain-containing protein
MKTLVQLAVDYRFLNNHQRALEFHERNLELANKYKPEPIQSWRSYFLISQSLNSMGLYAAARDYQKEALHTAHKMEIPQTVSRSYTSLGLIYTNRRDYDEAEKHLQLASEVADSFPEREARMDAMAYLYLHFGHLYSQSGDLDKAIESYDQAIQMYNELRLDMFGYAARKGKLLCCIARGGCESVEQELAQAISLFEQNRYKILEESNRNIFFAIEQGIYDLAIDYAYSTKKAVEAAFEYSEASRSRSLRDLTTTDIRLISGRFGPDIVFKAVAEPMKLKEIQARLSGGEQILQYAVLKERLLMWVVNSDGIAKSEEQAIASDALDEKVREYLRLVSTQSEDNPEELQRKAIELYDILIEPVEDALDKKKRLCIVPDKALNHLPFGALFSAASDKHLIEEYELIFAPGSSIYISCSQDAREKDRIKAERLLSVGDPRFDGKRFPSLDGLPSAAREAESVADYYKLRVLLTGETATETRVSSEMQRADVIHLALHAITDRDSPMRSKLLLASEPLAASFNNKADGVLEAHEIYGLNLSRAKLAVLSACRTGVERYYEGEGMVGLSRPFIARGVPLVVASLWPVDSDTTAELMIRFHNYRKSKNTSSVEALTRAQREMIESTDRRLRMPYYWASFVAIGGDSMIEN